MLKQIKFVKLDRLVPYARSVIYMEKCGVLDM